MLTIWINETVRDTAKKGSSRNVKPSLNELSNSAHNKREYIANIMRG